MALTVNEATIPVMETRHRTFVELWYVFGASGMYPTKIVAEEAARLRFPHEDPDARYARIGYRTFILDTDA
jgi:hypothetical protein